MEYVESAAGSPAAPQKTATNTSRYHPIGTEAQIEALYAADVERNPVAAIEYLSAHISQVIRRNVGILAYSSQKAVDLMTIVNKDPESVREIEACQVLIERARLRIEAELAKSGSDIPDSETAETALSE